MKRSTDDHSTGSADKHQCEHGVCDGDGCLDCDLLDEMDRGLAEDPTNYERMIKTAMKDLTVRTAARENDLRRQLGAVLEGSRKAQKMSIRELAQRMKTSESQVRRVLHKEIGGSLTLTTIVKACDVLGVDVTGMTFWVKW